MPVNAHIVETWVGNAVEELDELFAVEYLDDGYVTCEDVNSLGFHFAVGAYLDTEHVGASTASSPAFDDSFSVNDVTLPAVVGR